MTTLPTGRRRMPPRVRKGVLTVHIISSIAWLGLVVGNLAMSITGLTTDSPQTQSAVYTAMAVIANSVLAPVVVIAYVSGIVAGLASQWGLVRYRWVLIKLAITTVTATATLLANRASINAAADAVTTGDPGRLAIVDASVSLVTSSSFALALYVFMTVISTYKPWGQTRWGHRARAAEAAAARRRHTAGRRPQLVGK